MTLRSPSSVKCAGAPSSGRTRRRDSGRASRTAPGAEARCRGCGGLGHVVADEEVLHARRARNGASPGEGRPCVRRSSIASRARMLPGGTNGMLDRRRSGPHRQELQRLVVGGSPDELGERRCRGTCRAAPSSDRARRATRPPRPSSRDALHQDPVPSGRPMPGSAAPPTAMIASHATEERRRRGLGRPSRPTPMTGRGSRASLGAARRAVEEQRDAQHQRQPDDRVELVHVPRRREDPSRAALGLRGEPALDVAEVARDPPSAGRGRGSGQEQPVRVASVISPSRPSISTMPLLRTR